MRSALNLETHNLKLLFDADSSQLSESQRKNKRLVLFTNHRCGSNLLMSLISHVASVENRKEMLEHHQWANSPWTNDGVLDVDRMICSLVESDGGSIPFYKVHFNSFRILLQSATYRDFLVSSVPVYLNRNDVLGQAISLTIAVQSDSWHNSENRKNEPVYNRQAIEQNLMLCLQRNTGWQLYFAHNNIQPYQLTYETLCGMTNPVCHELCRFSNIAVDPDFTFTEKACEIQRNQLNELWREKFLQDTESDWLKLFSDN